MKKIYVSESAIAGSGLFAGEKINKGEIVLVIKGEKKFKINKNIKDSLANPDWVGIDENFWVDPIKPYKFLNHSCNPSCGIKGTKTLVALRTIKKGEEITFDYSVTESDIRWSMPCACGEKNCRKEIKSIQSLPKVFFNKYMPYIGKYFQKYINYIFNNMGIITTKNTILKIGLVLCFVSVAILAIRVFLFKDIVIFLDENDITQFSIEL